MANDWLSITPFSLSSGTHKCSETEQAYAPRNSVRSKHTARTRRGRSLHSKDRCTRSLLGLLVEKRAGLLARYRGCRLTEWVLLRSYSLLSELSLLLTVFTDSAGTRTTDAARSMRCELSTRARSLCFSGITGTLLRRCKKLSLVEKK